MFTGIVDAVGRVAKATQETGNWKRDAGVALTIRAPYRGVKRGESIAVNGACLTVERVVQGGFSVHAVSTTLERTLERALRAADRLGGHFVQGHVDGIGVVEGTSNGKAYLLDVRVPSDVAEITVLHGSITMDGVSLTVNALPSAGVMQVSLVPFTREHTTLGKLGAGDRVHVEADVLGKYVRQLCRSAQ